MKLNTNRLKKRGSGTSKGSSGEAAGETKSRPVRDLPWYGLFKDRGYRDQSIPPDPPPSERSYVKIEEWVTRGQWILEQDEDLAMDIWLRRVDPNNYVRQEPKPVTKPTPSTQTQTQTESGSPKKSGTTGGAFKRLGKRRKSASATPEPTGP